MFKHFIIVVIMATAASVGIRLGITHANVTAGKVGLKG